ncbi:hypothetical protein QQ41_05270 [Streptococcus equi subsp. zooepidemicus]|nr:hypothetical protein QQ41_05270 [Streptococcus equi subsp. zooepidemicus]
MRLSLLVVVWFEALAMLSRDKKAQTALVWSRPQAPKKAAFMGLYRQQEQPALTYDMTAKA